MNLIKSKEKFAGLLFPAAMIAGIFSVAPAVDSAKYLTEAASNANKVITAAIFQFMMALAYAGIAILLYPVIRKYSGTLSTGFLSLRIIAAALVVVGAVLLPSILALSQESVKNPAAASAFLVVGNVLKAARDNINHVFMILVLCAANFMFYALLLKSKLVPRWLSVWGLLGSSLSAIASVLVLFQAVSIITAEYLVLNAPTALQELMLGIWLIVKGLQHRE